MVLEYPSFMKHAVCACTHATFNHSLPPGVSRSRRQTGSISSLILSDPMASLDLDLDLIHLLLYPLTHLAPHGARSVRVLVLVAAVGPRPLQHFQVPTTRRLTTRVLTPVAAIGPRPLQYFKVPTPRRVTARSRVPIAVVGLRPLQHFKVSAPRRRLARDLPVAIVRPRPLHHFKVPAPRQLAVHALIIQFFKVYRLVHG
jgi:hypothetical protein